MSTPAFAPPSAESIRTAPVPASRRLPSGMPQHAPTASARRGRAVMLVPTYNEAGNIETLLDALFALPIADLGWDFDVLVRDDRSPDGTGDIVRELADGRHAGRLILSEGTKQGLGRAIRLGFEEALALGYDVVLTMDADFSHSPSDVPALLQAIADGADVAIGSRYIDGGLIPGNWPLSQIVRTRVAGAVARTLGGVDPSLRELTTNFRAVRRAVLESIDFDRVDAKGYGFQIFLANAFSSGRWALTEVPISFRTRAAGTSKAGFSDVVEFISIAMRLNDDSPVKQLARFVMVGLSGTVVNLGVLWLLRRLFIEEWTVPFDLTVVALSAVAIQTSIVWNFLLHNRFTFRRYRKATSGIATLRNVGLNFLKYELGSALTQTLIFAFFVFFAYFGVFYLVAQALGIAIAVAVNYWVSLHFVWTTVGGRRAA